MEIVVPAVPSPGIMFLIVGLAMSVAVGMTEAVGTGVVPMADVGVVGGGVPGGVMLVHPQISKNPIIRIAKIPVICHFFIIPHSFKQCYVHRI